MSPCCDLDLENSKPNFLHDTPAHGDDHNTRFGNKVLDSLEDMQCIVGKTMAFFSDLITKTSD